jgi:SAM-dependent methyltransferase
MTARSHLRRLRHLGIARRCPICRSPLRAFVASAGRAHAACPVCGSLERHRHLWLYLGRRGLLEDPERRTVVHVAPDPASEAALRRRRWASYRSGDLEDRRGQGRLDVTALDLRDGSTDLLLAIHVLEHVPDDGAALREVARVLRPGGTAILQVPWQRGPTREDADLGAGPDDRRARYGQEDHVRVYGEDFPDRVRAAGLECVVDVFRDELSARSRRRFGLVYEDAPDPMDDLLWSVVVARRPPSGVRRRLDAGPVAP